MGIFFALFCALVIVCAFRPDITEKIADFLYPERKGAVMETAKEPEADNLLEVIPSSGKETEEEKPENTFQNSICCSNCKFPAITAPDMPEKTMHGILWSFRTDIIM